MFSSKDGLKITAFAPHIAASGVNLLSFDFSGAGESEGRIQELSVLQEIDDLVSAVKFFTAYYAERIHVIGSSLGGVVAMMFSAKNPVCLASLVTIAAPIDLAGLVSRVAGIDAAGCIPPEKQTLIEGVAINNSFFIEALKIDTLKAAASVAVPWLAIHGENDEVVPSENADLAASLCGNCAKFIVKDGDHGLAGKENLSLLQSAIISWIMDH
jgi:pimeloyl-ACP methyl ester carboxylesterase